MRTTRRHSPGLLLLCAIFAVLSAERLAAQDDLCRLAELHAPSGREEAVAQYIEERLGDKAVSDGTGSITITYGSGSPHTLLAAGLDEPGYIVSGVTDDGYLTLQRLVDPTPSYRFDTFFQGWPVVVSTSTGELLNGVVAAPSVHFDRNTSAAQGVENLFVDVGAESREQVTQARIGVLDAVTLDKHCAALGEDREVTAPWISSRAGAAILLRLADHLARTPPTTAVTLAFVSRQHHYHAGLQHAARKTNAERVVFLRANGNESTSVSAPSGTTGELASELAERGEAMGLDLRRGSDPSLSLGPFGPQRLWNDEQQVAMISPAVRHAGTPVEVVDRDDLDDIAQMLARWLDVEWSTALSQASAHTIAPKQASPRKELSPFASLIRQLSELYGVSGAEDPVRAWIEKQLPSWARQRKSVDDAGNLIVRLGREGEPQAIFIAHMDEIGMAVTRENTDRDVPAESRGGGMADVFAWHPFWIHTATRQLPAIMTRHGNFDLGAAGDHNAARVSEEDTATVRKIFRTLLGSRITARSLDDRVGCAALLSVLQGLDEAAVRQFPKQAPVWFVFSVEEESGLVGARAIADRTSPERVYPVDSFVTSDSPLEEKRLAYAQLGEGFVLRAMDSSGITPRGAIEQVVTLARRERIPYQLGVTAGGNDGSTFVPGGAINIPLSFPLRYAHTPGEVADTRDLEALRSIVRALLAEELAKD